MVSDIFERRAACCFVALQRINTWNAAPDNSSLMGSFCV